MYVCKQVINYLINIMWEYTNSDTHKLERFKIIRNHIYIYRQFLKYKPLKYTLKYKPRKTTCKRHTHPLYVITQPQCHQPPAQPRTHSIHPGTTRYSPRLYMPLTFSGQSQGPKLGTTTVSLGLAQTLLGPV